MSQVPACNPLHCRVVVPDNEERCPPAGITLIAHILHGPYEHSLAFTASAQKPFCICELFCCLWCNTETGSYFERGGVSEKKGTSGSRTAGVSQIKQGSSVKRNRKSLPGKGIHRFKDRFFFLIKPVRTIEE